jgi:hypothetical protein
MDAGQVAHGFVEAYREKFAGGPSYAALSAIRLERLDELSNEVSGLANALTRVPDSEVSAIRKARNGCRVFGTDDGYHNPIDLEQFLHNLKPLLATAMNVQNAISRVTSILDAKGFVLDKFPTGNDAFGLTIYLPPRQRDFTENPDSAKKRKRLAMKWVA